jgi:hypothetical protein
VDNTHQTNNIEKDKKMKTTLTQKIDNYLEKTHGMITILSLIGVFVGALFALGMSSDYGITAPTSFGVVLFLVFFGVCLGGMGTWVFVEKVGEQNTANTARHLHKHYGNELEKVRAEIDALENDFALTIRKHNDQIVKVRNEFLDENELETSSLVNLMKIALNPSDEDHNEAMADLQAFIPCMDDEAITRYAVARWNGEGYGDDDMNHLARYRETYGGYGWEDATA